MSIELLHELWEYHRWANRRLFDVTASLGEEIAGRHVGKQFSVPTLRGMFTHLYAADLLWLERWSGNPTASMLGGDIATLGQLRPRWDALEAEQRRFLAGLRETDLGRVLETRRDGQPEYRSLGALLLHVPNHATHHRSEIATMLTMVGGSPPDSGINTYLRERGASPTTARPRSPWAEFSHTTGT
jgi:uncharacterized damage-inducible protein DinB